MKIDFEGGTNFITARNTHDDVVVRCNTQYTDLRDDESLDSFVSRHGGATKCAYILIDFQRKVA